MVPFAVAVGERGVGKSRKPRACVPAFGADGPDGVDETSAAHLLAGAAGTAEGVADAWGRDGRA